MVEMSTKYVKRGGGWKWVKPGENAISPKWKMHQNLLQNLLSNNNDAQSITKIGF